MNKIAAVAAVAENLAIGRHGKLPWHYKSDLRFFKETTTGNAIVMGWNTWESIGKPLPNRLNIVLSRDKSIADGSNVLVLRSREAVLELKKYLNCSLFIVGGAGIYQTFKADIERWIVTEIPQTINDADVFMPPDFLNDFNLNETKSLDDDLRVKIYDKFN